MRSASRLRALCLAIVTGLTTVFALGCGSGSGSKSPALGTAESTGRAVFSAYLPEPSRLIPSAANSIKVTMTKGGVVKGEKVVVRPTSGSGETSITFDTLPLGDMVATAVAFPSNDGTGVPQAQSASIPITVQPNVNTPIQLTMASTITKVEIYPSNLQLRVGESQALTATAKNDQNQAVLVTTGTLQWSASGAVSLDSAGNLTANAEGSGQITLTETESGKTITLNLTVLPPPQGLANSPWPKLGNNLENSYRGTGSGATGIPKWEATAGNYMMAPAIGSDGTIYAGSQDGYLHAWDGATGTLKWQFQATGSILTCPAISLDGTVYLASHGNGSKLYAINGATGAKKWEFDTGQDASFTSSSSPTIGNDGTVYVHGNWKFFAINGATGVKKWEFPLSGGMYSPPALGPDGTLYFGSGTKYYAVDAATGVQKWDFTIGPVSPSAPVLGPDGTLYVANEDNSLSNNKLYALNAATGVKKWEFAPSGTSTKAGIVRINSPAIGEDGTLYVSLTFFDNAIFDDVLYALHPSTGLPKWNIRPATEGIISGPSMAGDGTLYVRVDNGDAGNLYAVDGLTGVKTWGIALSAVTGFQTQGSPIAIGADGSLYFARGNKLVAIH